MSVERQVGSFIGRMLQKADSVPRDYETFWADDEAGCACFGFHHDCHPHNNHSTGVAPIGAVMTARVTGAPRSIRRYVLVIFGGLKVSGLVSDGGACGAHSVVGGGIRG